MKSRKYKFYFIVERFYDWKFSKIIVKTKPILRISHTINPDQFLNYNEFWENIHRQTKSL